MRQLLLLLTACGVGCAANAQNEMGKLPNLADGIDALKNLQRHPWSGIHTDTALQFSNPPLSPSVARPGLHRLPQDNMPCLVPDVKASVAMPNVWKGAVNIPFQDNPPQIPNPGKDSRLRPSRPLLILPEEKEAAK